MASAPSKSPLTTLDDAVCWERLAAHRVGRLVVSVGSQPDIFPVNYLVEDGQIIVRTAEGTKLAAAIMGGLVAFEIDEFDPDTHSGWSVVVHGTAAETHTLDEVMHDEALDPDPWASGFKGRIIHITPTEVTGRSVGPQAQEQTHGE